MLLVTSLRPVQSVVALCESTGEGGRSSVTSHLVQNMAVWDSKYYVAGFSVFKKYIKSKVILKRVSLPHWFYDKSVIIAIIIIIKFQVMKLKAAR